MLPASTTLGVQNPTLGRSSFPAERTVPCDDSDQRDTGPVNLQLELWVQNTQPNQLSKDLDAVAAAGLTVDDTKTTALRVVKMRNGNGYVVIAQPNDKGCDGVTGCSPCLLTANSSATEPISYPS